MSYPHQQSVVNRLVIENYRAFRRIEDTHMARMLKTYRWARRQMRHTISGHIVDLNRGMKWQAQDHQAVSSMLGQVHVIMRDFRKSVLDETKRILEIVRHTSIARTAWLLRSVTPPNRDIAVQFEPAKVQIREAQPPGKSIGGWADRFDNFADAWVDALGHNLKLNAIRGGTAADAADEVDVTRADTPAYTMWDKLDQIIRDSMFTEYQDGIQEVFKDNDDVIDDAKYHAFLDSKVCDECEGYHDGLRSELGDDLIPVHPYCRCAWVPIPQAWQKLMSPEDRQRMIDQGIDPDAMVIFDDAGKAQGVVSVTFPNFVRQVGPSVSRYGLPVYISKI